MLGNTSFGFSGSGGSTPPPVSNNWLLDGNTNGAEKYFGTNDNFSIPLYTNGIARGIILNTGDFGFGTTTPTSRVHITGLDSTSLNYALKVDNSAISPLLYVNNNGNVGIGIVPSISDSKLEIKTGADQRFNFRNVNISPLGNTLVLQNINDVGNNVTNVITLGLDWYQASRNNLFSNLSNISVPTAKVQIIGENSGDDLFALKVQNLALSPLFFIRNDGAIGVNVSSPLARFHNFGLNNSINLRLEPVADVTEDTTGGTVQTIDNTSNVTAQTISIPTDKVVSIESTIVYRKTAGAGIGTVGDGTTFKLNSSVKNVGGTLTLDTVQNTYTGTTNAIIGCSATYTISGTNVLVSVTGVVNDSITWNIITKVNTVS